MSDHQLTFSTRKVKRDNLISITMLKHYTVSMFLEELQRMNFLNYERFSCIDAAYNDFLNKLMKVVKEITPTKEIRLKNIRKNGLIGELWS